ncbi:MAG: DUF111 family protein [Firmicutes bacterium]|nr:DUF111 family protein [Bacillota bacterium]
MKKGKLVLAQVDHVSGETVGFALDKLFELGAKNVQLLQTATKKNRPGYLLLIDLPPDKLELVALFLAEELGIWGYHIMDSAHVHFDITFREKMLYLTRNGVNEGKIPFNVKYISNAGHLLSIKIEHDFLIDLKKRLEAIDYHFSTSTLRTVLEAQLWNVSKEDINIYLQLELVSNFEPVREFSPR